MITGMVGSVCLIMEGLSFLNAESFNRHARACLFCFALTLALSRRERGLLSPFGGRVGDEGEQESGRQEREMFIE